MVLLYFILGSIFTIVGMSLLQTIADFFESFSQFIAYKFAFKIWSYKKQMGILEEEEAEKEENKIPMGFHTQLIGTEIESSSQEYEEEE